MPKSFGQNNIINIFVYRLSINIYRLMERIPQILRNISILYYVLLALFVGVIAFDVIPNFIDGVATDFNEGRAMAQRNRGAGVADTIVMILSFPMTVAFIWSIVLLIRLIYYTGRSIARKDIFNPKCRRLINKYAIISGSMFVLMTIISLTDWSAGKYTRNITELIYEILVQGMLITMLVILGQLLRIGEIFKREQNLTI